MDERLERMQREENEKEVEFLCLISIKIGCNWLYLDLK